VGVERIDYSNEDEYQQALQQEREYWNPSYQQEPDVVPCFKCGSPMYWMANEPEGNICIKCRNTDN
jgi:hypothetical protein